MHKLTRKNGRNGEEKLTLRVFKGFAGLMPAAAAALIAHFFYVLALIYLVVMYDDGLNKLVIRI